MFQRRKELRHTLQTGHAIRVRGKSIRQNLDGYLALELRVARDKPHPCLLRQLALGLLGAELTAR
jgi:hypothetical protein